MAVVVVLARRCAWCLRVLTEQGWEQLVEEPVPDRETATICPECVDGLRELNLSR